MLLVSLAAVTAAVTMTPEPARLALLSTGSSASPARRNGDGAKPDAPHRPWMCEAPPRSTPAGLLVAGKSRLAYQR